MREKIKSENWALDSNKENMVGFFFFYFSTVATDGKCV